MELLAGARTDDELQSLNHWLTAIESIPVTERDFLYAAELYRTCRSNGNTIRKLPDCLISAIAIRVGANVLHCDHDFEALATNTPLSVESVFSNTL